MRRRRVITCLALAVIGLLSHGRSSLVEAQIEMPAASEMSGIPLPSGALDDGVISVRLIRGQLSNNVVDHPVELHGAGDVRTVQTDEAGRALFVGVPPGSSVRAVAEIDGQRLESQTFPSPAQGGVRMMLVASEVTGTSETSAGSAGPAPLPAARPGTVTFGGDSRFVLELGEDNLEVYYLLDIVNPGRAAVTTETPVVLDLPAAASGVAVLQGSTPQARLDGLRLEVIGPFEPGQTHLELAYFLPYGSGDVTIVQPLPVALSQVSVVAQRPEGMQLESAQITARRDANTRGRDYIVANGPALEAGATLRLDVSGLPHHSLVPRTIALVAAFSVLAVGFWVAFSPAGDPDAPRVQKLESRRERLFTALLRIEEEHREGHLDESRYAARRQELMAQLERVYRAIDDSGSA